jgi:uncharacterized membrane protein YhaH (DUF805 family)
MKWYLKVLRHYADFSGRARRKEFWMFALFNVIFAIAWTFLASLIIALINPYLFHKADRAIFITHYVYCTYIVAVLLPSMAVAVRRLHDLGKSGWTLLIGLIPFIGSIWLFILMVTPGQEKENRYGRNPKATAETFGKPAQLKSGGIALIVASVVALLGNPILFVTSLLMKFPIQFNFYSITVFSLAIILLLFTGIFLLKGKVQKAKILLLASIAINLISAIFLLIEYIQMDSLDFLEWKFRVDPYVYMIVNLSIALFAAAILFASKKKSLVRATVVTVIVFSSAWLLWCVYYNLQDRYDSSGSSFVVTLFLLVQWILSFSKVLMPCAYIVLAGIFLPEKRTGKAQIS